MDCYEEITTVDGADGCVSNFHSGDSDGDIDDVVGSGRFFVHVSYAEGFAALSQDESGENFAPRFISVKGYRRVRVEY